MFNRKDGQLVKEYYLGTFWSTEKKPHPLKKRDWSRWLSIRLLGKHFISQETARCTRLSNEGWKNYRKLKKDKKASIAQLKAALENVIISLNALRNRSKRQELRLKQAMEYYMPFIYLTRINELQRTICQQEEEIIRNQKRGKPVNNQCYIIAVKNEELAAVYNQLGYHELEQLTLKIALEYLNKSGIDEDDGLREDITDALERIHMSASADESINQCFLQQEDGANQLALISSNEKIEALVKPNEYIIDTGPSNKLRNT